MTQIVEALGEAEPQDQIQLVLTDDSTVEGTVAVIDYMPEGTLHVELEERDGDPVRYRVLSNHADSEWDLPDVERTIPKAADTEWDQLAAIESVTILD